MSSNPDHTDHLDICEACERPYEASNRQMIDGAYSIVVDKRTVEIYLCPECALRLVADIVGNLPAAHRDVLVEAVTRQAAIWTDVEARQTERTATR